MARDPNTPTDNTTGPIPPQGQAGSMEGIFKDDLDAAEEIKAKAQQQPKSNNIDDYLQPVQKSNNIDDYLVPAQPDMGQVEPVSRIESQNKETSWYKDVVKKFGEDIYTRFISKEGEGEFSKQLREIEEASGFEPGVMKDRPLADALHKTIQDIAYAGARTLEGYLGLASDAIRGTVSTGVGLVAGKEIGEAAGEAVMDPGIQATLEGIGPPGAMAAAGLHLISRFGTLGKVKVTGGFGDVTNLDRARDAGIIGPKPPEVHVKPDGTAMSAKEIADAQIRPPTAAYPSNRNYDAIQPRPGLFTDVSGSVKIPTLADIAGLFVKAEPVEGDKVRIHADHEATMLEAAKPLAQTQAKALGREVLGDDFNKDMTGRELYDALAKKLGSPEDASKALHAVGIQGIRSEEGHVVFDSRLVEPLQEKGKPVPPPPPKTPPPPPIRAHNGIATDPAGNIRTDVWKGIHDETDVRELVEQVNHDNGGFAKSRAGEMPAEHVETISEATGIPMHELVTDGVGIKFNNDGKVRAAMQALHDTAHQWHGAAQAAVQQNDAASLIKYTEQELLHGVIQEFVTGKLAEAGRSLAVTQEFYEGRGTQRPLAKEPAKPKPAKEGAEPEKPTFSKSDGLKEFREKVKDKETLEDFLKAKGDDIEKVRARAKKVSEIDPAKTGDITREGARLQKAKKIEDSPWYQKLYREALVSGPFSHFRYAVAGVIRNGLGATAVPFFNASLHTVEAAFGKQFQPGERARFGEIGMGLMTGHTEAFQAMLQSIREGRRPRLPGETGPEGGFPSGGGPFMRTVAGIHVYHSFIGYAREIKVQAYRRALEDGFDPRSSTFGQRVQDYVNTPTPAATKSALDVAQNMSMTAPLGKIMGPMAVAFRNHPLGFLVWPFTHIPVIVAKKGMEYSPVLQFLSQSVRDDLFGRTTATRQSAAFGKVMVGWGVYGTFAALGEDYVTGAGPTDPDQRAQWLLTNQPYSFRSSKDAEWHSYEGWGPLSIALGWSADMGAMGRAIGHGMTGPAETDQEFGNRMREFSEVGWTVAHGIGHIADESGLTTLMDLANLISGNERSGARMDQRLGSSLQPISLLGQAAASRDPWARQIDGVIDAFRARIPGNAWGFGRESLAQKLDWLGNPIANPRQGLGQVMPTKAALDPQLQEVYKEIQRLNINPARMEKTVDGLTLTPQEWQDLTHTFGDYVQPLLKGLLQEPGYRTWSDADRSREVRAIISAGRKEALNNLRQNNPVRFIDQVQDNKYDLMEKQKPSPNLYKRPE